MEIFRQHFLNFFNLYNNKVLYTAIVINYTANTVLWCHNYYSMHFYYFSSCEWKYCFEHVHFPLVSLSKSMEV